MFPSGSVSQFRFSFFSEACGYQAKNELADPAENPDSSRNALTAA